jgi:predicted dehydrogenase
VLRSLGVRDLRLFDADTDKAAARAPRRAGGRALEALEAGAHVFCEKPLSVATSDLPRLAAAIEGSGRRFMVGLCFRFHPGLRRMHRMVVGDGAVGRIVAIRGLVGEHLPTVRPDYETLFSAGSIGVFDLVHDLDLVMWFAGGPPHTTHAIFGSFSDIGIDAPDVAEVIMAFADRRVGSVHLDYFLRPRRRYLEAIGTEGTLRIDFADWDSYVITTTPVAGAAVQEVHATERDEMFREENRHFLQAIVEGTAIDTGMAEGTWTVEVLERIGAGQAVGRAR